jgi:outer membrane protein OmpA-like peptidoglycan-associated protein
MKIRLIIRMFFLLASIGLLIQGCAQAPLKSSPIAKTDNPAELIKTLGHDLSTAKGALVDKLSPTWFDQAQASYFAARKGLDKGDDLSGIWEDLSKGRAQLAEALQYADQSRYHLSEVLESREKVLEAGGQQYKKAFAKLDGDLLNLTRAVEKKNYKYVRNHKAALNQGYRDLELQAIQNTALNDARVMLKSLESQKAQKIAPQSHAQAKAKLQEAEAFIVQNRYAKEDIASHAATARFYIQRLKEMAAASAGLKAMTPEGIALQIEDYLHQTAEGLGMRDQRNLSFEQQQAGINDAVLAQKTELASLKNEGDAKTGRIEKLEQELAEVEGSSYRVKADKERLAAEKRFNELFNKVQGYFKDDEAEVYKQGDRLVIRCKAIKFPVGQAVIVPENYDLLAKVQRAITTFGRPKIIVEGHTDSTGTRANNELLSQKRAESVRSYLVANGTLPGHLITAVGYGPSRPLAPNETAAGRAINRRIDVVILPGKR